MLPSVCVCEKRTLGWQRPCIIYSCIPNTQHSKINKYLWKLGMVVQAEAGGSEASLGYTVTLSQKVNDK